MDAEDSAWKAELVFKMLRRNEFNPASLVEVGCGAGGVLAELRHRFFLANLVGYDNAPDAAKFWTAYEKKKIAFVVGDFLKDNDHHFDVLLLLDVVEHVVDPFSFSKRYTVMLTVLFFLSLWI